MSRPPAILLLVAAWALQTACSLDSDGLFNAGDGGQAMSVSAPGDGSASDGGEASPTSDGEVVRDGCARCADRELPPESDGALLDAPLIPDAEQGRDGSGVDDSGPRRDAESPVDGGASCLTGAVTCLLIALPCCTVATAGTYYGTCAPVALCR